MRRARTERRRTQSGVSFVFMFAVLIAIIALVVAGRIVSRWNDAATNQAQTNANLKKVATALEQYAATATRLPCPADPTQDTGLEVPGANSYSCGIPAGTVPWQTIGLRRDDSFDGWGWKIDYRVYTGNAGSLVQPGGASMVNCNTSSTPSASNAPTGGGAAGGQCQPSRITAPGDYSTANTYLQGKGLAVSDYGVTHPDSAYVLISHGPTGYGAYTTSGLQKPMPSGDELANTRATATFQAHAWSDPTVGVSSGQHFDDLLLYRSVADLVKNANLSARAWTIDVLLNQATISAAIGPVSYGDLGRSNANLGTVNLASYAGGTASDLSLVNAGPDGIGVVGGGPYFNPLTWTYVSNYLTNAGNEYLQVAFPRVVQQLAVTLNNFGYTPCTQTVLHSFGFCPPPSQYTERVQFDFFRLGVKVATVVDSGCQKDGGLASFSMDAGTLFDSVNITPLSTAEVSWAPSFFLVSEVGACGSGVTCTTSLSTKTNTCTANTVTQLPASVMSVSKTFTPNSGLSPSTSPITIAMTYANVGNIAASNVALTDALPSGMNYVANSGSWSGVPNATLTDASDGWEANASGIDFSYDSGTGTVNVVIQSVPAGASGYVTFQVTVPSGTATGPIYNSITFGSLTQQPPQATNPVTYTVTQ